MLSIVCYDLVSCNELFSWRFLMRFLKHEWTKKKISFWIGLSRIDGGHTSISLESLCGIFFNLLSTFKTFERNSGRMSNAAVEPAGTFAGIWWNVWWITCNICSELLVRLLEIKGSSESIREELDNLECYLGSYLVFCIDFGRKPQRNRYSSKIEPTLLRSVGVSLITTFFREYL